MEFEDVAEVITVSSTVGANDLLDKGWTLLAVVAGNDAPDFVFVGEKASQSWSARKTPANCWDDASRAYSSTPTPPALKANGTKVVPAITV